jgi:AcrR family transcriptional regulator
MMDTKGEKRRKIIEIALRLFIKHGFHGTPTSLIAKEAKIANGTLFNYFKTKDILINETFKEIKLEQKKVILDGIDMEKTSKGKLRKIWKNLIIWGIDNPEKKKFLEYFNNSHYITENTKIEVKKSYKFLLEIFEKIKEKKGLENTDELMLILNFIGNCMFTGKYFDLMNIKYDEKKALEPFERFCKSIELTEED